MTEERAAEPRIELSFVIPVFNGATTIEPLVERIHRGFADLAIEVVLVNDGSRDATEAVCLSLRDRYPRTVTFVHLSRNFGEHNAVLAGLRQSSGAYVAVLDDDGQNPPEEVRALYNAILERRADAVYGRFREKRHSVFRNLGSRFNDRMANLMLGKPKELYLSSFKIMNRFTVDQVARYGGAFPYIDGLILRATHNLAQIDVEHLERGKAESGYTLRRLVLVWLNMFLGFSITPLRLAALLGFITSVASVPMMLFVVIEKLFVNPDVPVGFPMVLTTIVFFAGVQLLILGAIGEYLGRLFLDQSGAPQFVVRYVRRREEPQQPAAAERSWGST